MNALNRDLDITNPEGRNSDRSARDGRGFDRFDRAEYDSTDQALMRAARPAPWRPLLAAFLALAASGSAGAFVWALAPDHDILALSREFQIASAAGIAAGGLLIFFIGLVAHEAAKARMSARLMTLAARRLLAPAAGAAAEVKELGAAVRAQANAFEQSIRGAQERLQGLELAMGGQVTAIENATARARAQTAAMADHLERERVALGELGETLQAQAQLVSQAVSRSARIAAEAAGLGEQEMKRAEATLADRRRELDTTIGALRARGDEIVKSANEALARSQALEQWLIRTEDRVGTAGRAAESARRSTEMAVAAAEGATQAIQGMVGQTLEDARKAAEFVRAETNAAGVDAAGDLEEITRRAEAAERAIDASRAAVQKYAIDTEAQLQAISESFAAATARAEEAAEERFRQATRIMEQAAIALGVTADRVESADRPPPGAQMANSPVIAGPGRSNEQPDREWAQRFPAPLPEPTAASGATSSPASRPPASTSPMPAVRNGQASNVPVPDAPASRSPAPIPAPPGPSPRQAGMKVAGASGPQPFRPVPPTEPAPGWTNFMGAPGGLERDASRAPARSGSGAPFSSPGPGPESGPEPEPAATRGSDWLGRDPVDPPPIAGNPLRQFDPFGGEPDFPNPFRADGGQGSASWSGSLPGGDGSAPSAGLSWKDLLASIDDETAPNELSRARHLAEDLGIKPQHVFRGVDLDRILAKARHGAAARRKAVQEIAGELIRKIDKRFQREERLARNARQFVDGFAPEFAAALHAGAENGAILSLVNSEEGRLFLLLDASLE